MAARVQVLARPEQVRAVAERCFLETTTLGLRWTLTDRLLLPRTMVTVDDTERSIRVKVAGRPGGRRSAKAEMIDVGAADSGRAGRVEVRAKAEQQALARADGTHDGNERADRND